MEEEGKSGTSGIETGSQQDESAMAPVEKSEEESGPKALLKRLFGGGGGGGSRSTTTARNPGRKTSHAGSTPGSVEGAERMNPPQESGQQSPYMRKVRGEQQN